MTITYKNFLIEVSENSFDLYQKRPPKQNHKLNVGEEVKVSLGYFSKLRHCVEKIIQVDMSTRQEKVSLSNFMELYRTLFKEIDSRINL